MFYSAMYPYAKLKYYLKIWLNEIKMVPYLLFKINGFSSDSCTGRSSGATIRYL